MGLFFFQTKLNQETPEIFPVRSEIVYVIPPNIHPQFRQQVNEIRQER